MQDLAIATIRKADLPTAPGTPLGGDFFTGLHTVGASLFALIVAPKAEGEQDEVEWNQATDDNVAGAESLFDGLANTKAMAEAGSDLAKWALSLDIGGFTDWHLPAVDQLEIAYRVFKPTVGKNYLWARSGINLSAVPPTFPYTASEPAQTSLQLFQKGAAEAFESEWYWTSTQYAAISDYAWVQDFSDGGQDDNHKSDEYRARAVRSILVIQ